MNKNSFNEEIFKEIFKEEIARELLYEKGVNNINEEIFMKASRSSENAFDIPILYEMLILMGP